MSMSLTCSQSLNTQSFLTHLISMLLSVPIVVLSTLGVLAFLGTNLLLTSMMSSLSASLSGKHCIPKVTVTVKTSLQGSHLREYPQVPRDRTSSEEVRLSLITTTTTSGRSRTTPSYPSLLDHHR